VDPRAVCRRAAHRGRLPADARGRPARLRRAGHAERRGRGPGLPMGVQVVAARGDDVRALQAAHWIQQVLRG
jgi:Asp-tRNA(Asn)/Glu-tRNA(Gln) amidotransferase A subunit family amidase